MTAVLEKRNAAKSIWEALYLREFFYIDSITEEFGFDGRNPELQQLITETVANMNGETVLSSTMLPPAVLSRYASIMHLANAEEDSTHQTALAKAPSERPILTYIIPASRDARWAMGVLESIASQPIQSFEAIIVDCGASDNTMSICKSFARQDHRFRVLEANDGAVGLNDALDQAQGFYLYICMLRKRFVGDSFAQALLYAANHDIEVMLLDTRGRFVVDAMRAPEQKLRQHQSIPGGIVVGPIDIPGVADFALNCSYPHERSFLVQTDFLRANGVRFGETDIFGDGALGIRALLRAQSAGYLSAQFLEKEISERAFTYSTLEMRDWKFDTQILALPNALALRDDANVVEHFGSSLGNLIAESFVYDLLSRRTAKAIVSFFDDYHDVVVGAVAALSQVAQPHDPEVAEGLQLMQHEGLRGFLVLHYLESDICANAYKNDLNELAESRLYQLADRIRALSMSVLPTDLISRIRGKIAASN